MPAEYRNPNGTLSQGYFCSRCGGTSNMMNTGHGRGKCVPDPAFVLQLVRANRRTRPIFRVKAGRRVDPKPVDNPA